MNEFKGTPEKWAISEEETKYNKHGVDLVEITGMNGCVEGLATVYECKELSIGDYMANSRLIASAPDLLEALKIVSDKLYAIGGEFDEHEIANAALNKALNG